MGLTEETIDVEIKIKCKYTYNGRPLDSHDIDIMKDNIRENLLDGLYNVADTEITFESENFHSVSEEIETNINGV